MFVTKSYDATSHFESATDEILDIYTRITGEKLDMNIEPTDEEEYWNRWITKYCKSDFNLDQQVYFNHTLLLSISLS